jgi:hypothetical protein
MPVSNSFLRNVAYDVLITVVVGGLTSIVSTVLGGATLQFTQSDFIAGTLVAALVGLIALGLTVTTSRDILVEPINESGSNLFHETKAGGLGDRPQEFWVQLRFYVRSRYRLTISNIDLQYQPSINPTRRAVTVEVAGEEYDTDGNYRLETPVTLPPDELIPITLSREFQVWDAQRASDYGAIVLELEALTSDWPSMKTVRIRGELAPGGTFEVESVDIEDGWLLTLAEALRRRVSLAG